MAFLNLIKDELGPRRNKILSLVFLAGLSHSMVIVVINKALSLNDDKFERFRLFLLFLLLVFAYIRSKRAAITGFSSMIENLVHRIRCQLVAKIQSSPLQQFERIGPNEFYTVMTRDINNISEAGRTLLGMLTSMVVVLISLLVVASISKAAFLITLLFLGSGVLYYLAIQKRAITFIGQSYGAEQAFFHHLHQGLQGFKEIKLNSLREKVLYDREIPWHADRASELKKTTMKQFSTNLVFAQTTIFSLLGTLVFTTTIIPGSSLMETAQVLATILYFFGPLSEVVGGLPYLSFANVSLQNLQQLQDRLSLAESPSFRPSPLPKEQSSSSTFTTFQQLRLQDIVFAYNDTGQVTPFHIGPLNLSLNRGEIVFLVGGNGSGKSTLIKLLTGLYAPQAGRILIDQREVTAAQMESYRNLFSLILTDFHLFDRLYGLEDYDTDKLGHLISLFKLDKKVQYGEGRFQHQDLSTGERKRLALIVSQMEDRPILILDEWAAEQDPRFRKFFYEDLLPLFKSQGKAILLVTHDDRYFHHADHLFKMDQGHLIELPGDTRTDSSPDSDPINPSPEKPLQQDRKTRPRPPRPQREF